MTLYLIGDMRVCDKHRALGKGFCCGCPDCEALEQYPVPNVVLTGDPGIDQKILEEEGKKPSI